MKIYNIKLEHILSFVIDISLVIVFSIILNLIFGFPRIFDYYAASNELVKITNQDEYIKIFLQNEYKLDQMIFDILTIYGIYDIFANIFFSQTIGKRVFKLKTTVKRENKILKNLSIISKSITKVFSIMYIIPFFIISIHYLITKGEKTILDKIFGSTTI